MINPDYSGNMQNFRIELLQGVSPIVLESIDFLGD